MCWLYSAEYQDWHHCPDVRGSPLRPGEERDRDGAKRHGARVPSPLPLDTNSASSVVSKYIPALALFALPPAVPAFFLPQQVLIFLCSANGQMRVDTVIVLSTFHHHTPRLLLPSLGWPPHPACSSKGYSHFLPSPHWPFLSHITPPPPNSNSLPPSSPLLSTLSPCLPTYALHLDEDAYHQQASAVRLQARP